MGNSYEKLNGRIHSIYFFTRQEHFLPKFSRDQDTNRSLKNIKLLHAMIIDHDMQWIGILTKSIWDQVTKVSRNVSHRN